MIIFKSQEYISMENPTPGEAYRPEILTQEQNANLNHCPQCPYQVLCYGQKEQSEGV